MAEATPEKKIANAMKAMDEGDFKKAYTAFKKLAAELPDNAEVWYYKAECGNYASGMFGAKVDTQEIMDAYNAEKLGKTMGVLVDGYDEESGQFYGRTFADSPDIDGRVWFTAEEEVPAGTFVSVRLTGTMDGELTGETV